MSNDNRRIRRNRLLRVSSWVCWIPLLSLVMVEWSLHRYDGWHAWSAAPLLLVPAMISLCVTAVISMDFIEEWRNGSASRRVVVYLLVSSLPIIWLALRGLL